jgi:diguanylate cyclase (GGDEF)-like protein
MIELLQIPLECDAYGVTVGKRIHRLALDIGFSAAMATRFGLAACEIVARLDEGARESCVSVGFQPADAGFYLAIAFPAQLQPAERDLADRVFDRVTDLTSGDTVHGCLLLQEIPDRGFTPTESFLQRQRKRISELSRTELLSELSRRNEELRALLVELRSRAEDDRRREQAAVALERRKNRELSNAYVELDALREKDRQLANYDILTGLPSRVLFHDRLTQAIAHSRRDKTLVALCFMDLDHFKAVNDTAGHGAGDRVLAMVADRLREGRRDSDTLARIGGDEFTLILPGVSGVEAVRRIAQSIIASITQPFMIDGARFELGISIGVAFFPGDAVEPETLIRNADKAVYAVKAFGRNNVCFYAELDEASHARADC